MPGNCDDLIDKLLARAFLFQSIDGDQFCIIGSFYSIIEKYEGGISFLCGAFLRRCSSSSVSLFSVFLGDSNVRVLRCKQTK